MRRSAFLKHCRSLSVAVLGAMLAFPASAQTASESQASSTDTASSESQAPSTGTPGAETQSESQGAPTSSNPAIPEPNSASTTTQPRKTVVPDIPIVVSKPTQTMTVTVDGRMELNALFAGVGQRGYAPCDLFHATGTQHSWFGPSWPWHRCISWMRSSDPFKRNCSLSTRQVGRHGEDEGCRQWT